MKMKKMIEAAATHFAERRNGNREEFFRLERLLPVEKFLEFLTPQEYADTLLGIARHVDETVSTALMESAKTQQEAARLGECYIQEYSVPEFCERYHAAVVGEKIKVTPPPGILHASVEGYVDRNREQIMNFLRCHQ